MIFWTRDLATWNPTCCSPSLHKCGIRFGRSPYVNTGKIAHNSSFSQKVGSLDNLHEAPCALNCSVRGSLSIEEIERGWSEVERKNFWAPCRLPSFFSLLSHRLFPDLWSLNFLTMFWSRLTGATLYEVHKLECFTIHVILWKLWNWWSCVPFSKFHITHSKLFDNTSWIPKT